MAEQSSQDRNLPASHRKLIKAREEGQVARSRELGYFIALAACGAMLVARFHKARQRPTGLRFAGRWVEERQHELAQMAGFTVVHCSTVLATHLSHLMQLHAAKLRCLPEDVLMSELRSMKALMRNDSARWHSSTG